MPAILPSPRLLVAGALVALVASAWLAAPGSAATSAAPFQPPTPTPVPTVVPPPPSGSTPELDRRLAGRAPAAAIGAAMANPDTVLGWNQLLNPSAPAHPIYNPRRTCLTLRNLNAPYHPFFNSFVFKAGCP
jgi:hypothetical protein